MAIITNNTIDNNNIADSGVGGGIYCKNSNITIDNCIVLNHKEGGGIYIASGGNNIIRNSIISHNNETGIASNNSSYTQIYNNMISYNVGSGGAGIMIYDGIISSNIICNNEAYYKIGSGQIGGEGGGIYTLGNNVVIEKNLIAFNHAMTWGGGIVGASVELMNNIICHNVAGGGSLNDHRAGGGIYFYYNDKSKVANCLIYNNEAEDYGGGIYCNEYSII